MSRNDSTAGRLFDVVGIGNAIVDVLVKSDDSFLANYSLVKGSMSLVDQEKAEELYKASGPGMETSGGSAANTLSGISQLGGRAGFIGRVKKDQLGNIFTHDIKSVGTHFETPPAISGPSTARCLIFVTPDGERTMCTYLGASVQLEPEDLELSIVKQTKVLYLEGYLWDNPSAKRAFVAAAEATKASQGKVALSLSDSFCVDRHRESFLDLVKKNVDILFANEGEIISLFQSSDFETAMEKVKDCCDVIVLTRGETGSVVLSKGEYLSIPSYSFGDLIDTTGAGDLYASGFLYGYTNNKTLLDCGKMGSICAAKVVTQLGPRPQSSLNKLIIENI